MALPAIRAVGAKAQSKGNKEVEVGDPAGVAKGDLEILIATTVAAGSVSIKNAGGTAWNALSETPIDVTGGEKLYVWTRERAEGDGSPKIAAGGDHACAARVAVEAGTFDTATPTEIAKAGSETTSDTSFAFKPEKETGGANRLCVVICSSGVDSETGQAGTNTANTSLTSIVLDCEYQTKEEGGGGFWMAHGTRAAKGTVGEWTQTMTAASPKAYVSFAIRPSEPKALSVELEDKATFSESRGGKSALPEADTITLSELAAKAIAELKADSQVFTESESQVWTALKTISEGQVFTETSGREVALPKADTLVLAESLVKGAGLSPSEALVLAETINRSAGVTFADTAAFSEALTEAWEAKRSNEDTILTTDTAAKSTGVTQADTLVLAETLARSLGLGAADALALAETMFRSTTLSKSESQAFEDTFAKAWAAKLGIADSLVTAEETTKAVTKLLIDALATSDTFSYAATWARTTEDEVTLSEVLQKAVGHVIADSVGISETTFRSFGLSLGEVLILMEEVEGAGPIEPSFDDIIALVDQKALDIGKVVGTKEALFRRFDGEDDYIECDIGASGVTGEFTMAVLVRVNDVMAEEPTLIELAGPLQEYLSGMGRGAGYWFYLSEGNLALYAWETDDPKDGEWESISSVAVPEGEWVICTVKKVAGLATPQFGVYSFNSGWTRGDGDAEFGTPLDPVNGAVAFGNGNPNFYNYPDAADFAAASVWDRELTEAEEEQLIRGWELPILDDFQREESPLGFPPWEDEAHRPQVWCGSATPIGWVPNYVPEYGRFFGSPYWTDPLPGSGDRAIAITVAKPPVGFTSIWMYDAEREKYFGFVVNVDGAVELYGTGYQTEGYFEGEITPLADGDRLALTWEESTGIYRGWRKPDGDEWIFVGEWKSSVVPDGIAGMEIGEGLFFEGQQAVARITDFSFGILAPTTIEQGWAALDPVGLWDFKQASVGEPVLDLTGNGADQTAILDTEVGEDELPLSYDGKANIAFTDALREAVGLSKADSQPFSEVASRDPGKSLNDGLTLSETQIRTIKMVRAVEETLSLTDSAARRVGLTTADLFAVSELLTRSSTIQRVVLEGVKFKDALTRAWAIKQLLTDILTLGDFAETVITTGGAAVILALLDRTEAEITLVTWAASLLELGDYAAAATTPTSAPGGIDLSDRSEATVLLEDGNK